MITADYARRRLVTYNPHATHELEQAIDRCIDHACRFNAWPVRVTPAEDVDPRVIDQVLNRYEAAGWTIRIHDCHLVLEDPRTPHPHPHPREETP